MEVRVEQGVFHFVLGEMAPAQSGKTEFIPAFRGVIPEGDAAPLFAYLKQRAEASKRQGVTVGASDDQSSRGDDVPLVHGGESFGRADGQSVEAVKKKKIAVSDGKPHTD